MKCRDCKNLVWGYDEGERVWWCGKHGYCPDLDVERSCSDFSLKKPDIFTALSTLQAENERLKSLLGESGQDLWSKENQRADRLEAENENLRDELEYEKEHANAYYEECGQWEAENTQLRAELEQVKAERDEAVECVNTVYSYILIKSKTDAVRTIEKWLRGQKED